MRSWVILESSYYYGDIFVYKLCHRTFIILYCDSKIFTSKNPKSAKGDLQNNARDNWATFLAVVIKGWFLISGILAKLDVYTDVAF